MYPIYIIIWDSGTHYFDFMYEHTTSFYKYKILILPEFQSLSKLNSVLVLGKNNIV